MKWIDYVQDVESYKNFFCVIVRSVTGEPAVTYRLNDKDKYIEAYNKSGVRLFGFNSNHYDDIMIKAWLGGYSTLELNVLSNQLINLSALERYHNIEDYNELIKNPYKFITGDLMKMIGKANGLKMLGILIGHKRIQELPINFKAALNDEGKALVLDYCENMDISTTLELYNIIQEGGRDNITTRASISTREVFYNDGIESAYNIGAANLAEEDIRQAYFKKYGIDLKARDRVNGTKGTFRSSLNVCELIPQDLEFTDKTFQKVYDTFYDRTIEFIKPEGQNWMPKKYALKVTDSRGRDYTFGNGGGHSCNDRVYIDKVPEGKIIINSDFESYYPNLIIQNKLNPAHMNDGFLYKHTDSTIGERFKWKALIGTHPEAKAKSDGGKLKLNSTFGKLIDINSFLYDPFVGFSITCSGQMWLLKLVDMYFNCSDAEVINLNTDGVCIIVSEKYKDFIVGCNRTMEAMCGISLEEDYYSKWIQKSCNMYMAVDISGKVKGKGADFGTAYNLEGGMGTARIIPIAFNEYVVNGTPIEDTILYHDNLQEYLMASKKSPKTFDVFYGEDEWSNINRYYKSTRGKNLTYYDRDKGTKGQIPKASNVIVCNDIVSFYDIPADLDYNYYINATWNMINSVKYGYEGGDDIDASRVHQLLSNREKVNVFARMSGLPLRCTFTGYGEVTSPKLSEEDKWLDNLEQCTALHLRLGDGLHSVTVGDNSFLCKSEILADTSKLQSPDGKMFDSERGFSIKSEGWIPLWGIVKGEYYDNDFKPVQVDTDEVRTVEAMYTSALKHFKYKKKGSPKAYVTVSKGKYETTNLEEYSFTTGQGVIDFINSLEYFEGDKEDSPMLNLWKYSDDRAISENAVSVSGLMLDIDGGDTIQSFCEEFSKFKYTYYTSASHKPREPKFRFILPFAKPVPKNVYMGYVEGIKKYFDDRIDASSVAVSRRFYGPTVNKLKCHERGSNKARSYLSLDMFEYNEHVKREIVKSEKSELGSMWYIAMLPDIMQQFDRAFYECNRHQAIINCATVLGRNGYNAEEIFEEMSKVDKFVNRDKYSDDDVMKRIVDTLRRY